MFRYKESPQKIPAVYLNSSQEYHSSSKVYGLKDGKMFYFFFLKLKLKVEGKHTSLPLNLLPLEASRGVADSGNIFSRYIDIRILYFKYFSFEI